MFDGYRITSPYGIRSIPNRPGSEFHTGIDLVKAHQAPIAAFTSGEVVHAGMGVAGSGFGGFGIVVALQDKYGALHAYCHLDRATVAVGNQVEAGQMVGYQGSTGQVTGSHLHYEVRTQSRPSYGYGTHTDPGRYLQDYLTREVRTVGKFKDVPDGHWAAASIAKAAAAGVMAGTAPDVFGLGQPVTREQLAVILDRLDLLDESGQAE